ncbi:hypothetical protein ITX44_19110 [Streptomyces sp. KK5PA1]|uniref:Uncharacterized protein n=1 Tax=Actinacidiphila acididurans TaxID=2784346 RepID=A0ABS2TTG1_9ACTN|nr:hypothetical protein [Actinacidiphila acididurans]
MGNAWAAVLAAVAAAVGTWIEAGSGAEGMTCTGADSSPAVSGDLAPELPELPEQPAIAGTRAAVRKHAMTAVEVDR